MSEDVTMLSLIALTAICVAATTAAIIAIGERTLNKDAETMLEIITLFGMIGTLFIMTGK